MQPRAKTAWIISPWWDMALVVGSPLVIVPLLSILSTHVLTPDQISLAVLAFASAGHHLPGFMRAYGEKELFQRFRPRFLLAPPLVLAVSLYFGLNHLHGLALVMLFWSTWHGLMQTYGFMRIYDLKRGVHSPLAARLDFWLCLLVFTVGIVFSDSRVFAAVELMMLCGAPQFGPAWVTAVRVVVGGAFVLVAAAWLVHFVFSGKQRGAWPKAALATSTGWLYWTSGALSTNVLVGVAMFEIFHALQYFAIVWIYNCRLAERVGPRFGPLGFLFQNRVSFLGIYLAAIAAFGAPFYFSEGAPNHLAVRIITAVYTASAVLHFYYDGFIWKVSERKTSNNLGIEVSDQPAQQPAQATWFAPIPHIAKWAVLGLLLVGLGWLEMRPVPGSPTGERQLLATLADLTPDSPELHTRLVEDYLDRNEIELGVQTARRAVARRPRAHTAHYALGRALSAAAQPKEAAAAFHVAAQLAPRQWRNWYRLARSQMELEQWPLAEQSLLQADRLDPHRSELAQAWGDFFFHQGNLREALPHYQQAVVLDERSPNAWTALAASLAADGSIEQAITATENALALTPGRAELHFQVGDLYRRRKDYHSAAAAYKQAADISPKWLDAHNNYGAMLFEQHRFKAAAQVWRRALKQDASNADAHYNLALALAKQSQLEPARRHMRQAAELGRRPSAEITAALGL